MLIKSTTTRRQRERIKAARFLSASKRALRARHKFTISRPIGDERVSSGAVDTDREPANSANPMLIRCSGRLFRLQRIYAGEETRGTLSSPQVHTRAIPNRGPCTRLDFLRCPASKRNPRLTYSTDDGTSDDIYIYIYIHMLDCDTVLHC